MRDDTEFLLNYLPQLEATFSYACLALSAGLLSPEQQKSFGQALIHTGNRLVAHSAQPVEKTEYNSFEVDAPRCWVDTPYALHRKTIAKSNPETMFDGDGVWHSRNPGVHGQHGAK